MNTSSPRACGGPRSRRRRAAGAIHGVRRRIEPHRFLDHHARVAQPGEVLESAHAAAEHGRRVRCAIWLPPPDAATADTRSRISASAVVSWPAMKMVTTWSRTSFARHAAAGLGVARRRSAGPTDPWARRPAPCRARSMQSIDRFVELGENPVGRARERDAVSIPARAADRAGEGAPSSDIGRRRFDDIDDLVGVGRRTSRAR